METDFRVRMAGHAQLRTRNAPHPAGDRCAEIGPLPITCPDRPGIVSAVSPFLFPGGANITESRRYSAYPFCGYFFLWIESHLAGPAEYSEVFPASFGEIAGRFSLPWQMTRTGPTDAGGR